MPAIEISPETAFVTKFLLELQNRDRDSKWRLGDWDSNMVLITQYEKDIAYLTYHLKLPTHVGAQDTPESISMKILALIRNPVGAEIIRCPGCGGIAEINVPDPTEQADDMGTLYGMMVPCPSCNGHGWIGRKS